LCSGAPSSKYGSPESFLAAWPRKLSQSHAIPPYPSPETLWTPHVHCNHTLNRASRQNTSEQFGLGPCQPATKLAKNYHNRNKATAYVNVGILTGAIVFLDCHFAFNHNWASEYPYQWRVSLLLGAER
jgi:hypothetical protein